MLTNKELAVQLYSAFLQAAGQAQSNPNLYEPLKLPTIDKMVSVVEELTKKLAAIDDE